MFGRKAPVCAPKSISEHEQAWSCKPPHVSAPKTQNIHTVKYKQMIRRWGMRPLSVFKRVFKRCSKGGGGGGVKKKPLLMASRQLSHTVVLMREEEQRRGGWRDNLRPAGDGVAMATNKDVCIKSQRRAACCEQQLTKSDGDWSGPEMRGEEEGRPLLFHPVFPGSHDIGTPPQTGSCAAQKRGITS